MMRLVIQTAWMLFYTALFGAIGLIIGAAIGWLAESTGIGNPTELSTVGLGLGTGLIAGAVVGFVAGVTRFSQHVRTAALTVTMLIGAAVFLFSGHSLAEDSPWLIGLATAIGAFAALLILSPHTRATTRYSLICIATCVLIGALVGAVLGWGRYAGNDGLLMSMWTGMTMGLIPGISTGLVLAGTRNNQRIRGLLLALVAGTTFFASIYIIYSRIAQSLDVITFFGVPWPSEIFLLVLPISIYWAAIMALLYVGIRAYRSRTT